MICEHDNVLLLKDEDSDPILWCHYCGSIRYWIFDYQQDKRRFLDWQFPSSYNIKEIKSENT